MFKKNLLIGQVSFFLLFFLIVISCKQSASDKTLPDNDSQDSLSIATLFARTKINKDSADIYIKQAEEIVHANNTVKSRAIYLSLLGKEMIYAGRLSSADSIADEGLKLPYDASELRFKGKFYNIKGNVAGLKKNVYQSIEFYLNAEKLFETAGDSAALAGIYSNVANAYFSLKDYVSVNKYATKAYRLLPSVKEPGISSNIITTYAFSLNKTGKSNEAMSLVKQADSLADATGNKMAKIAATIGLATVYFTLKNYDSAKYYYAKCIMQSTELGIKHFELMSNMGLLGLYEEEENDQEIIKLAAPTIALAEQLHNTDVLHTAKRISGRAFGKQGNYEKAYNLLNQSYMLYDSVAGIENQKNINELMVKYDTEKKGKEILNKNLLLAKQEAQLRSRQMIILGLILGLAILFTVYFYVQRLNRERLMRLEIEKQKKIGDAYMHGEQKERTRLAFEIHDGIASMLTGISYKLRAEHADKEEVLGLLGSLHEDTRRISHSLMPIDFEKKGFVDAVQQLCKKMTTKQTEVVFFSGTANILLEAQKSLLLYRLIQEIINNALKYAQCKSIFVRIGNNDGKVDISVEDDGIGISEELTENGFVSIRERVRLLGAHLSVESRMKEGTTIKISYSYE